MKVSEVAIQLRDGDGLEIDAAKMVSHSNYRHRSDLLVYLNLHDELLTAGGLVFFCVNIP
ncbi:hypothetical protein DSUL_50173 [Desulfovibrionales bacterium]